MINRKLIGYTAWARKTLSSDVFFDKPDKWFKIWFCIVQLCNHEDNGRFKRGEVLTTYQDISSWTGATHNQIDSFIRWAKRTTMITTRKTTRGMYIKVLKYSTYQAKEYYQTDTETDSLTETQPKHNRNTTDTINNNVNNDNNTIGDKSPVDLTHPLQGYKYTMGKIPLTDDGDIVYEYEGVDTTPKKYKSKSKLYAKISIYYMTLKGETGDALRYFRDCKELVEKAEHALESDDIEINEENIMRDITTRIQIAKDRFEGKNLEWSLNAVVKNYNSIIKN